jgi:O-antigen/teichoic acid export membrane protein
LGLKPNHFDYAFLKTLGQRAFPFFAISLIAGLYANIDRLFLFSMDGSIAVGIYAAAYRIVSVPIHLSASFHQAIFPTLSRHARLADQTKFNEALKSSIRYLTLGAVPLAIGTTALAEPIIHLIYGPAYTSGTVALQILIWAYTLEFFNPFFSRVLYVVDRQRVVMKAAVAGTVLNILLNIILIPTFSFIGAAIATLASAGIIFVLLYLSMRRLFPSVSLDGISVAKTTLSGMLMWIVMGVFDGVTLIPLALIGGGVYFLALIVTRSISIQDLSIVSRILGIAALERR